jgi:hypothetical protein
MVQVQQQKKLTHVRLVILLKLLKKYKETLEEDNSSYNILKYKIKTIYFYYRNIYISSETSKLYERYTTKIP